jgi:hypothetical protein
MRKLLRVSAYIIGVAVVGVQFIRPAKNASSVNFEYEIGKQFTVPTDIRTALEEACYNCHSNNTNYPWYAEVQPVGWWLDRHIVQGKREVNFSEFSSYRPRRQYRKLKDIAEQVEKGEMPLPSYVLMHSEASLTPEQKSFLIQWANAMRDSMKAIYPLDSLERRSNAPAQSTAK